jgi:hypothetical protein
MQISWLARRAASALSGIWFIGTGTVVSTAL